ncbi:hypothetical protein A0U40_13465 [[Bacillus] sp. KCTC 13219]|nr:hypothetical protein A0U40_13465 [[Bacillus] sp. KCTC 13219]
MGVFVCDECNCIENTALGHYWARNVTQFKDSQKNGKALCSECTPREYSDGSKTNKGTWHGRFSKKQWDGKKIVMNR